MDYMISELARFSMSSPIIRNEKEGGRAGGDSNLWPGRKNLILVIASIFRLETGTGDGYTSCLKMQSYQIMPKNLILITHMRVQ